MRPAPHQNEGQSGNQEDRVAEDPLSYDTQPLWNDTARRNREIFTEIFRPVPTNLNRSQSAYDVCYRASGLLRAILNSNICL
ncbi:hypothetical protein BDY19DRAFT_524643 [Irpex rosettiformis]|uniref:Uncharacterized protein n=1 Tax=Irpex rosettiformis TaxID=378272 RepID=A0ACB8TRP1_9APHY|nr:hypothetical protein BDY19DRAFT_524643 [Irpex rosettiformis]